MSLDYATHLAAHVLNDEKIVTYRSLSRTFKVHGNVAKRMLFDFHQQQQTKKPGSVHATYLVSGVVNKPRLVDTNGLHHNDGEDVHMQSSPFMSSSQPQQNETESSTILRIVSLVREEDLQEMRALYNKISTIHIYSLEPGTIQNLQALSDCTRKIFTEYANDDPLQSGRHLGVIQNAQVKRRSGAQPSAAALAPKPVKEEPVPTTKAILKKADSEQESMKNSSAGPMSSGADAENSRRESTASKSAGKVRSVKKEQSDIFRSFSKPKPRLTRENTDSSAGPSPAPAASLSEDGGLAREDEPMKDASEDEQEEDFLDSKVLERESSRTAKAEREEQLRKMMEDDDDSAQSGPDTTPGDSQESKGVSHSAPRDEGSAEPSTIVSGGRRRGRRKVIKKKMLKDDEGYLVTKEEPAWESFSEDEPAPARAKSQVQSLGAVASATGKRVTGRPGQGNIMSFFGKK